MSFQTVISCSTNSSDECSDKLELIRPRSEFLGFDFRWSDSVRLPPVGGAVLSVHRVDLATEGRCR